MSSLAGKGHISIPIFLATCSTGTGGCCKRYFCSSPSTVSVICVSVTIILSHSLAVVASAACSWPLGDTESPDWLPVRFPQTKFAWGAVDPTQPSRPLQTNKLGGVESIAYPFQYW